MFKHVKSEFEIKLEGPGPEIDPVGWGQRACTLENLAPDRPVLGWAMWPVVLPVSALSRLQAELTWSLEADVHPDDPWHLSDYYSNPPSWPMRRAWSAGCSRRPVCETAPGFYSVCGVQALRNKPEWFGPDIACTTPYCAYGEVLGWGRIAVTEEGWVSEFGYPLSIRLFCQECFFEREVFVPADAVWSKEMKHSGLVAALVGRCARDNQSHNHRAQHVARFLRQRYLGQPGTETPLTLFPVQKWDQILQRFDLGERQVGQDTERPAEFQRTTIMSLVVGREKSRRELVCQACGQIGIPTLGSPLSGSGRSAFAGKNHDFVCSKCVRLAQSVASGDALKWIDQYMDERDFRICGICRKEEPFESIRKVRKEWICSSCFSKLEDVLTDV